jgi:hypothetical protein
MIVRSEQMSSLRAGLFLLLGAGEPAIRVSGVVQDASGAAIPAARVALQFQGGDAVTQFTGKDGRFDFDHVCPGSHLLTFHSPGFKQLSVRLEAAGGNRDLGAVPLQIEMLGCPVVEVVASLDCSDDAAIRQGINDATREAAATGENAIRLLVVISDGIPDGTPDAARVGEAQHAALSNGLAI